MYRRNPYTFGGDVALVDAYFHVDSMYVPFIDRPYLRTRFRTVDLPRNYGVYPKYFQANTRPASPTTVNDVQPLVVDKPPRVYASPVIYKPVPVVYAGDKVVLAGSVQFPLPREVPDSIPAQDLSNAVENALNNKESGTQSTGGVELSQNTPLNDPVDEAL